MSGAFRHGIYINEVSTNLISLSKQTTGLTMVIGTAPIHLASEPAAVNEPVLCESYQEAVRRLGYSSETSKYTLCEAMEVLFGLYNVGPVVFVNVLDPARHKQTATETATMNAQGVGEVTLSDLDVSRTVIKLGNEELPADWTYLGNDKWQFATGKTSTKEQSVTLTCSKVDAGAVTSADVIGGVDATTGKATGLELVTEVYPRFGMTIGQIIAPKWSSTTPGVAMAMAAKARSINGHFSALALADLPAVATTGYAGAITAKNSNYTQESLVVCYPQVSYGGQVQYLSTHLAGVLSRTAQNDDDIPYRSPGNQTLYIDGMVNGDGTDNYFGWTAANELNSAGIVTVLRQNGWRVWGDRTSIYP